MEFITPQHFLDLMGEQEKIIEAARAKIESFRELAEKCPPPQSRRPAVASDIFEGAIIWHERNTKEEVVGGVTLPALGDYWQIVMRPTHYGEPFKAYVAEDGGNYGLHGAYVEIPSEEKNDLG